MTVLERLARMPPPRRRRLFVILLALTLLTMAALQGIDGYLRTPAAPLGIVSFELAGTLTSAAAMLQSWDAAARGAAGVSLGLDYLFIPLYAVTIALGLGLGALPYTGLPRRLAVWLARGQVAAALLDVVENGALVRLLLGDTDPLWPALARWCALPKFALIAAGIGFLLVLAAGRLFTGTNRA